MFQFLLLDHNVLFSTCLAIVAGLAAFEVASMIIGMSLVNILDDFFHIDLNHDVTPTSTSFAEWTNISKVPAIIWLAILLTGFGLAGLTINFLLFKMNGLSITPYIIAPIAFIASIPFTRTVSAIVGRIMPKDESSAVCTTTFAGKIARITIGKATQSMPAEAMVTDEYGQNHYILVKPEKDIELPQDTEVVLFTEENGVWLCDEFSSSNQSSI